MSPIRAAGILLMRTVKLPSAMTSGGPTHTHMSPTRAAGMPPIRTVMPPGGRTGPPTCGTGGTPGVTIGQTCMSPTRAAGCPMADPPQESPERSPGRRVTKKERFFEASLIGLTGPAALAGVDVGGDGDELLPPLGGLLGFGQYRGDGHSPGGGGGGQPLGRRHLRRGRRGDTAAAEKRSQRRA